LRSAAHHVSEKCVWSLLSKLQTHFSETWCAADLK